MTSSRTASYAALWALLATGLFAFSPACFVSDDDTRGLTCAEARERGRVCNPGEGVAGTGGIGGMSGSAGGQFNGMGGTAGTAGAGSGGTAGVGGVGGGGSSGAGPCPNDDACVTTKGAGSLCISDACTQATGACDSKTLVVVAPGRTVDDAALANACHFRDLDAARAAFGDTTVRLALYADSASSTQTLAFKSAALLDGHHSDSSQPVALTLSIADATLVSLPFGGTVRGVALIGDATSKGIVSGEGALSLTGPLRIEGASVGLELGDNANATATALAAGPIAFVGNVVGVQVGAKASVTLRGDAQPGSLLLEGNGASTGLLVLDGDNTKAVALERALVTKHAVGVEIRRGRAVTVSGSTFVQDRQAVTLNAEDVTAANLFLNVVLTGNDFSQSRPAVNQGVAVCGSRLGVDNTILKVGQGNVFPSGNVCSLLDERASCDTGGDLGFDTTGKSLQVQCL
jgi:hypothetical protein